VQSSLPVFGAAFGNSVLDDPSQALPYFASHDVLKADTITIKAIGYDGTSRRLTLGSNFKIESLICMAQKAFNISHKCELYVKFTSMPYPHLKFNSLSDDRYYPRDNPIVDVQAKVDMIGIVHGETVFIGSKAAAAASLALKEATVLAERAAAELKERNQRDLAAVQQKRRDTEAIASGAIELNAMFDKALAHLDSTGVSFGGAAAAANAVENVVELDELLLHLCEQAEALADRVPQLKSIDKVVEPCLQRLFEAMNHNRERGDPVNLDEATPRTKASFKRFPTSTSCF
jgi:hypothetical protein